MTVPCASNSQEPCFGVSLPELILIEGRCIPVLIETACDTLLKYPQDGQFRRPGDKGQLGRIREQFDSFHKLDYGQQNQLASLSYELTDLLKCLVQELPEPIFS